jgi:predicted permease
MTWLEMVRLETRYALRALLKHRGFTLTACLSLAIGIGANTAAFSVWDAVLLRSLPVRDPRSLVVVSTRNAGSTYSLSHPSYDWLRTHASTLEGLAAFRANPMNVSTGGAAERMTGMLVSGTYFGVLGVEMALGSPILPDDDLVPGSGGARGLVAVVSHQFWRQRLNGDASAIGRVIRVNGQPFTVVGVAPSAFHGTTTGSTPSVFIPMMFARQLFDVPNWLTNPRSLWLRMMGRLKPGATIEQAQAEMTVTFRQFHQEVIVATVDTAVTRRRAREAQIVLEPGHAGLLELGSTVRPTLFALLGLVGLVMAAACVNVAGLMAARAERLHRETAICVALGATRARVWMRAIIESLALGAAGIGLGLLLAAWMRGVLVQLVSPRAELVAPMDARVFAVSVLLGVTAALLVSAAAAWSSVRLAVTRALKGEDLSARLWLRKGLIVGQLAVSMVVLVAAALFAQTLTTLRRVDPGFAQEHILLASMGPAGYSRTEHQAFRTRVLEHVRRIPGVLTAALADHEPLDVNTGWSIQIRRRPGGEPEPASASVAFISPDYFRTMGIALVRGRDFDGRDATAPSNPVIVNENFVRTHLRGADPLGMPITGNGNMTFEIVGVVRDVANTGFRDLDQQMMYVPYAGDVLHVRAAVPPATLRTAVEDAVHRLNPDVPVFNVRTIEQQLDRHLLRERTFAVLSSTFGLLALVLSAVGLYGVVASTVSRRTKELGIRLALGAGPRRIVQLVMKEAGWLLVLGVLAGVPCALAIATMLRGVLFGIEPWSWMSVTAAVAVLFVTAGAAAWAPARRAARVDPLLALRAD